MRNNVTKCHATKETKSMEVTLHLFLTSAVYEDKWSALRFGRFTKVWVRGPVWTW